MSEREFHDWLGRRLATSAADVIAGVGTDDCAILDTSSVSRLAVSTDTIVEGTHFNAEDDPLMIGTKAVMAALSDLAASGCRPKWGLVALNMRKGLGDRWAMRLMEGIAGGAKRHGLTLVGGDTTSAYGPTGINVTVMGEPYAAEAVRRDLAKPGDLILVTGELGGSISGKHMSFEPRFKEMQTILSVVDVHSAMDITDGLALDLTRLLCASNVAATIEETEIPVSDAARELSLKSGKSPMSHALSDGEDFELLLTVPHGTLGDIMKSWKDAGIRTRLSCIGRVESGSGLQMASREGTVRQVLPAGYDHSF